MKAIVLAGLAALTLNPASVGPVTEQQVQWARQALERQLLDYPSARFRDVRGDSRRLCGFLNSKNRLGAYTGWKQFLIHGVESATVVIEDEDRLGQLPLLCGEDGPAGREDYSNRLTHRPA